VQRELFLVALIDSALVGSAMAGYDGHRGWVYYVGTDPAFQRSGIARALLEELERRFRALGCPKMNLSVLRGNREVIGFYERIGFKEDPVISFGKRLERDEA
jgi:ribosomal protein S18 acetylase RimI-like enzyme